MAWTATILMKVPDNMAAVRGPDAPRSMPIYTARSEGKPGPPELLSFSTGDQLKADHSLVKRLQKLWAEGYGLYGTGYVGEVRDMLHALQVIAYADGLVLEVPEPTRHKAKQEAEAAVLPEGAVW